MRVTNEGVGPIPPDFETLRAACKNTQVVDVDLVLDVYAVCTVKSKNVDFKEVEDIIERFDKSDPQYWKSRMTVDSRLKYLEDLSKTNYMEALINLGDPMKAALTFLDSLDKCAKAQAAKIQSNTKPTYDFEIIAGSETLEDETLAEIEAMEAATAQDFDNVDNVNNMLNNITTYEEMMQDEAASAFLEGGGGQDYDTEGDTSTAQTIAAFGLQGEAFDQIYNPGKNVARAVVEHGNRIPQNFPKFFDIFKAACEDVGSGKGKQVDAESSNVRGKRSMEEMSEIQSVDPAEMVSETFEVRAANKELEVKRTVEDVEGRSHLFALIDVSGSMSDRAAGGVSRAFAANAIMLALLKYALEDKYKVWIVPFAGDVDVRNVQEAGNKKQALEAMRWLGSLSYRGGSTSIESALLYAYKMLKTDPKYRKCEIVLITDGASTVSHKVVDELPPNTTVRTIFLTSIREGNSASKTMTNLKKISKTSVTMKWDGANNRFDFGDAFVGLEKWDR